MISDFNLRYKAGWWDIWDPLYKKPLQSWDDTQECMRLIMREAAGDDVLIDELKRRGYKVKKT